MKTETSQIGRRVFDLEERSFKFARRCRDLLRKLPRSITLFEYGKQLLRSSASQAANYIEANEALSKKDFVFRVRISKKETKESILWLKLIDEPNDVKLCTERASLMQEAIELMKIYGAIIEKSK